MVRRRAPPKRPGATPAVSSSPRKNPDTRRLLSGSSGTPLAETDVLGFVRAVLLGVLVGGVVAFLFYPDISSLINSWQPTVSDVSSHQPAFQNKDEAGRKGSTTSSGGGVSERESKPQSTTTDKRNSAQENSNGSSNGRSPSRGTAKKAKNPKRPAAKPARREETSFAPDGCICHREPVEPPRGCEPPEHKPKPKPKPKKSKKKAIPKEEVVVNKDEEVVEEEDPVEVELMEEEELQEPIQYIDLKDEDEEPKESSKPAEKEDTAHDDSASRSKHDAAEEPMVLKEAQSITFTPVSEGDENIIHFGGRPKAGKETSDSMKKTISDTKQPETATSSNTPSRQKSPPNSETPSTASEKNKAGEKAATQEKAQEQIKTQEKSKTQGKSVESEKIKTSQKAKAGETTARNSKNSKTKKGQPSTKSHTDAAVGLDDPDLPEEVRNFKPTFLKTVTAKKIFQDGRRIPPIELLPQKKTNSSVKAFLFNDFLSEAECDGLRRVHDKHVQGMSSHPLLCFDSISTLRKHINDVSPSVHVTPNDFVKGTKCLNASFSSQLGTWMSGNWSYSTAFYPGESRFSDAFASRVERAMGLDPANGGKFQITSYPQGKAYKAHTDCVLSGTDPRDRVATVLVYLDDVDDGGETKFPELDIWVKPRKGRALVWNNMSPQGHCEPHSLHVASKVNSGSKYILIRWYYYKSFYSLGKRPYEPELPRRPAGTPRVSCDDYDNGSCRWYDEWNNDHLVDYEYRKYKLI